MKVFTRKNKELERIMTGSINTNFQGITLNRKIKLIQVTQPPISDTTLRRIEAGARRNWAIRAGLLVRETFTFGYGSKLMIELSEAEKVGLTPEEITLKIEQLTKDNVKIIKKAYNRDEKVKFEEQLKTMWWQLQLSGRGLIIKFFDKDNQVDVKKLMAINSRRLGIVVFDENNNMEFEGVIVDGQGLMKESMIYATYYDRQISPHTELYGYPPLETVQHIADELNTAVEDDYKEIIKSAWLASILFVFNTGGLTSSQARTKINKLISSIKGGKYIGINEDVIKTEQLKLDPDYTGLIALVNDLEQKIYKVLQVPQFLVQSEAIANRATAIQSAQLFINGPITNDQTLLSDISQEQWYDEFLKTELRDVNNPNSLFAITNDLPFHLRRIWNQPKVADFMDLADAITKLITAGVWDVKKGNEELGSEEVTPRAEAEKEKNKLEMQQKTDLKTQMDSAKLDLIKNANKTQVASANTNLLDAKIVMLKELIENAPKS